MILLFGLLLGFAGTWARRVSNLRPLACEASALPLSYAPWNLAVYPVHGGPPVKRGSRK